MKLLSKTAFCKWTKTDLLVGIFHLNDSLFGSRARPTSEPCPGRPCRMRIQGVKGCSSYPHPSPNLLKIKNKNTKMFPLNYRFRERGFRSQGWWWILGEHPCWSRGSYGPGKQLRGWGCWDRSLWGTGRSPCLIWEPELRLPRDFEGASKENVISTNPGRKQRRLISLRGAEEDYPVL